MAAIVVEIQELKQCSEDRWEVEVRCDGSAQVCECEFLAGGIKVSGNKMLRLC
jgi:hypothetical protein